MTTSIMPTPRQRYFTNSGTPAAGCQLFTYAAGTSTPKATYTDAAGLVPHPNPITLDAKGEAVIYWSGAYKVDLKTAAGVQITGYPVDNVESVDSKIATSSASAAAATALLRSDLAASSGAGLVGAIASGAGAVATTEQEINSRTVHVFDYMTTAQRSDVIAGALTLDVSAAIQAAIDAVSPIQGAATRAGTVLADPRYPMLVRTAIDCTNSRAAATKVRDGLRFLGFNLIGETGAGNCVIETTGSQWLELDGVITSGSATKSTVGVLQAISAVLPQTQNQKIHVRIFMHDDAAANGGCGTVGIWNFGAEENTYNACYIQANIPAFVTSYKVSPNFTSTIPPSFQSLIASHSCGVNTWAGETFLVSLNQRKPSLITEDVNSFVMQNVYMANIGAGGGNLDAWWVFGAFQGGSIQGTIEQHTGFRVTGAVIGANLRFTFGGLISATPERITLTRGGQGQIIDSDIDLQDTASPNRQMISAPPVSANELISCCLRNVRIRCNSDKQYLNLPENLAWNPNTGNVRIEGLQNSGNPYRYEISSNRKANLDIPAKTCYVYGGASGAEIVRFIAPTVTGAANALSAVIKIAGMATIAGSTTSAESARYAEATLIVLINAAGALAVSGATVITGSQNDNNTPGNSISALSVSAILGAGFIQIVVSPTVGGTNHEDVKFIGSAEMLWSGNESRAPSLQLV